MDSIDSPYFRFVIDRIQAWKSEKPSILSLGVNKALGPLNWAVRAIVPQRAIQAVLDGGDWLAQKTIRDSHVSTPDATLQDCDVAAGKARSWAIGYAVAEGTAAGAVGILSTPVDIPATIMLSLRTIRRIGACYGFAEGGEAERSFVMGILASAGASSVEERLAASLALREIQTI